jgi:hypothetical protein
MAVTKPQRRPSLIWSRLHFLVRFLGLTGALAFGVGLVVIEPSDLRDVWSAVEGILLHPDVGGYLLATGAAAALLAVLVELLVGARVLASRRSAFGLNAFIQVVLAFVVLVAVNVLSVGLHIDIPESVQPWVGGLEAVDVPAHFARIDRTRDKLFTLPEGLGDRLRKLDPKANTTIVVYQRHKTFGNLTDKPDRYDYAAERKVVEKVRDLVELLREVGPQLKVEVLDVEEEHFEDRLDRLTRDAPELRKAIEAAPENSIFIAARDPAHPKRTFVQQMSFNELYQLDRVRSKDDNDDRGNLVLLGQGEDGRGIGPFVRRILNVEQRPPRIGILVVHRLLTSEGQRGDLTLAGLRKVLQAHGFEVRDVVLRKGWERGPPQPAADTFEESKLERLEARLASLDAFIRRQRAQVDARARMLAQIEPKPGEDTDKKLKELFEEYGGELCLEEQLQGVSGQLVSNGKVTPEGRKLLLQSVRTELEEDRKLLQARQRNRERLEQERSGLDLDRLAESSRLTDVKAKLTYSVADCDLLLVPRLTRTNDGDLILPRLHRLAQEQAEVVRAFLKAGKPILACLGPINEPPGMRVPPQYGPPGPDDLEGLLAELGFHLGQQTVLFDADASTLPEQNPDELERGASPPVEVPPLDFTTPARAGYPRRWAGRSDADESPLRQGLRVTAHSVGSGFDLRLRFPRPVYYRPPGGKKPAYEPTFLLTAPGWNEKQPFLTREGPPKESASKLKVDRGTLDEPRQGPFSIAAAAEADIPASWGGTGKQKVRVAVIGQGDVFTGTTLSPARERLFLQTANWLLGRDDYLPRGDHEWSYPRLALTPEQWEHRRWLDATAWGLPVLFAYLGLVVLLYRRLR